MGFTESTAVPRWVTAAFAIRRRYWTIGLIAAAILTFILFAILEGDLPEVFGHGFRFLRPVFQRFGPGGAFGLLYLEESGVPMPLPGDVFVMYVGHHSAPTLWIIIAAWLGLIVAVVFGASNLYLASRHWGRSIVERKLGRMLNLTPARMDQAERWFSRWGVWTLVFGRHIPGFRVPLTIAAGIFRVRYPIFLASVVVSTAVWAAIFMAAGIMVGGRIAHFLDVHHQGYVILPAVGIIAFVGYLLLMRRRFALSAGDAPGARGAADTSGLRSTVLE